MCRRIDPCTFNFNSRGELSSVIPTSCETKFEENFHLVLMVERKETSEEKYEKASDPQTMQRLTSTRIQEPKTAPVRQQNDITLANKTIENFYVFEMVEHTYVDINATESSAEAGEAPWNSRTKKEYTSGVLRVQLQTVSVKKKLLPQIQ